VSITRKEIVDKLERIADSMDMDVLNRSEIEGIVDDIKKLQWKVNCGIQIEVD
jgi:hypothetical protein|tara:strand:- start:41 stop:199 length:159 start_codon:yes stop_codon:yes gene_type:complete